MKPVIHNTQVPTKWIFVGDVAGWSDYHVGDEAMLAANLDLFRSTAPAAELVVVSADPSFTANEYGVRAVARLGFDACTSEQQREALLAKLSDPALAAADLPEALAQLSGPSVGLVISGGGNLASAWPNGICERLALCRRAAANNAPIVILGQTIGPDLIARDHEKVAEILACAAWIGVREAPSFALALELGAPLARMSFQLDDAASFGDGADTPLLPFPSAQPWIAITFHPLADPAGSDPLIDQLAAQLDRIGSHSGCHLTFIPHAQATSAVGARWSDEEFGHALARRMRSPLHVMPLMHARDVARVTARAQMVVSSRYHPLVFGLAAGIPCLGVFSTPYTWVKLMGALDHHARADLCSIEDVRSGRLAEQAALLWDDRAAAARAIATRVAVNAVDEDRRKCELRRFLMEGVTDDRIQPPRLLRMLATALQQHDVGLGRIERTRAEAERYALDLKQRFDTLTASMAEATVYARSLEQSREQLAAQTSPFEQNPHAGHDQDEQRTMLSELDWQQERTAAEAEKYALSLKDDNEQLRNSIAEARRRAASLEHEIARLRHSGFDLDDLREENRRLLAAVTQMRAEILTLNRALDTVTHRDPEPDVPVLVAQPAVSEEVLLLRAQAEDAAVLLRARTDDVGFLRVQTEDLSRRLRAMHDSYSWRVTGPLRKLASALRILD